MVDHGQKYARHFSEELNSLTSPRFTQLEEPMFNWGKGILPDGQTTIRMLWGTVGIQMTQNRMLWEKLSENYVQQWTDIG